jgi:hypothetical protein
MTSFLDQLTMKYLLYETPIIRASFLPLFSHFSFQPFSIFRRPHFQGDPWPSKHFKIYPLKFFLKQMVFAP